MLNYFFVHCELVVFHIIICTDAELIYVSCFTRILFWSYCLIQYSENDYQDWGSMGCLTNKSNVLVWYLLIFCYKCYCVSSDVRTGWGYNYSHRIRLQLNICVTEFTITSNYKCLETYFFNMFSLNVNINWNIFLVLIKLCRIQILLIVTWQRRNMH